MATSLTIDPLTLALISAAGGALVSSIFTALGQILDRRHKRKELLFNAAVSQARQRVLNVIEVAKVTKASTVLPDEINLAGTYYRWLQHLFDHGMLPQEAIDADLASQKDLNESREKRSTDIALHNERTVQNALGNPASAAHLLSNSDLSVFSEDQIKRLRGVAFRGM